MSNCSYCFATLSERGPHCPQCGKQAKCKTCGDLLDQGALACVLCGTLVGEPSTITKNEPSVRANTFELEELSEYSGGKNSRNIRLVCSDAAVSSFADLVERRIMGSQLKGNDLTKDERPNGQNKALPSALFHNEPENSSELDAGFPPPKIHNDISQSEVEVLNNVFRRDGSVWKLDEIELGASSKLDYARRLTFLFLYLNELHQRPKTPRSELNSILEDSTVSDGNTRHWLANEGAISKDGDLLELNAAGRRQAREFIKGLKAIDADNWRPGLSKRKSVSKVATTPDKGSKDASGKRSSKNPKTAVMVSKWKSSGNKLDGHRLLSEKTDLDKGLFALWAIRQATSDEAKVVSSGPIATFLFDAFEIKVHKRNLERAFVGATAKGKVTKISGTSFQLLPPGSDHVKKIIGG
jgi:hypothetical protein